MSMTPQEAEYEEFMDRLYEEHKEQVIDAFSAELLQSYYRNNGMLAKPAYDAFIEAKRLINVSATAAFVFAAIATEVALRETLLKPIVHGLVHAESVVTLVTDLVMGHQSLDRYKDLLLKILLEHSGVDLLSYKRTGSGKNIWEEIKTIRTKRNHIVHAAKIASEEETDLALSVACNVIETLFPSVITKMGFHLHDGYKICSDCKCQYEGTPIGKIIKGS